jgi:hypothetical protein
MLNRYGDQAPDNDWELCRSGGEINHMRGDREENLAYLLRWAPLCWFVPVEVPHDEPELRGRASAVPQFTGRRWRRWRPHEPLVRRHLRFDPPVW